MHALNVAKILFNSLGIKFILEFYYYYLFYYKSKAWLMTINLFFFLVTFYPYQGLDIGFPIASIVALCNSWCLLRSSFHLIRGLPLSVYLFLHNFRYFSELRFIIFTVKNTLEFAFFVLYSS